VVDEIRSVSKAGYRTLVTVLTKKMAEDLTEYMHEQGIRVRYMHSDIDTIERIEIIRDLRLGAFDALVGINLLREGLDIPECALVAILDADKEGFLRSETSLIQTIGRAARNVNSKVILYADSITPAMKAAMDETARRRTLQTKFNQENGITPATVIKSIRSSIESEVKARKTVQEAVKANTQEMDQTELVKLLEEEMLQSAQNMEFERAAQLRDKINELKGAPVIKSGGDLVVGEDGEERKIWRPKQQGRGGKGRKIAK